MSSTSRASGEIGLLQDNESTAITTKDAAGFTRYASFFEKDGALDEKFFQEQPVADEKKDDDEEPDLRWRERHPVLFRLIALVGLLFLACVCSGTGVLFLFFWPTILLGNVTIFWWGIFASSIVLALIGGYIFSHITFFVIEKSNALQSSLYFFVHDLHYQLTFMIAGIIVGATRRSILVTATNEINQYLSISVRTVVYVAMAHFVVTAITRGISARLGTKYFYKRIKEALYREQVLEKLMAPRPRASNARAFFSPRIYGNRTKLSSIRLRPSGFVDSDTELRTSASTDCFPRSTSIDELDQQQSLSQPQPIIKVTAASPIKSNQPTDDIDIELAAAGSRPTNNETSSQPTAGTFLKASISVPSLDLADIGVASEKTLAATEASNRETSTPATHQSTNQEGAWFKELEEARNHLLRWKLKKNWNEASTTKEATKTVDAIFRNLEIGDDKPLTFEHFLIVYKGSSAHTTKKAFRIFAKKNENELSKAKMIECVKNIISERKNLSDSLQDREDIAVVIRQIKDIVFWLTTSILLLIFWGVSYDQVVQPAGAVLLSLSFIFAETAKKFFQSFILIFIMRPFDIGDRIKINNNPQAYIVEKIHLLLTRCRTPDGRTFYLHNSELANTAIVENHSRSNAVAFSIEFDIAFQTPVRKILDFKSDIENWLKKNSDEWNKDLMFTVNGLERLNKIQLSLWISKKYTKWNQVVAMLNSKTEFLLFLKKALIMHKIEYSLPRQPVEIIYNSNNGSSPLGQGDFTPSTASGSGNLSDWVRQSKLIDQ